MNESDGLFCESTNESIVNWLLKVKRPDQCVMVCIIGLKDSAESDNSHSCDTGSWEKWHSRGCDFSGYAFGVPGDFRPHKFYDSRIETVRKAFKSIK